MKMNFKKETLDKIANITLTRYDDGNNNIDVNDIENMILDLICYYDNLKEEFEDYKEEIKENYKQISVDEQYEVYDSDFMN